MHTFSPGSRTTPRATSTTTSASPVRRHSAGAIQTKLTINEPGDSYEREADRVAEQVMRTPGPQVQRACACGGGCPKCRAKRQPDEPPEGLQTKRAQDSGTSQFAAPPIVHDVLRSPGQPLGSSTRAFMEAGFGTDFSHVRVHTDAAAQQSARDVNAHAYTAGHHVVFGTSQFAPETAAGQRLIAHELTHVVQQSGADTILQRKPVQKPDIKPIPALAPLEVVAREAAKLVLENYAADQLSPGPVLSAVHDEKTGKIYIGLNSGIPPEVADVVAKAIAAQKERIAKGEVIVVRTDPVAQGGHSEANAVNEAVRAREAMLKRTVTEIDLRTFVLHNVWLKGADRKLTAAPRCEHCARITRSVSVTSAVFFAEGGVSGTIKKPPTGGYRAPRVGPGGATGAISGTIDPGKPRTSPSPAPPKSEPPTGPATGIGGPPVAEARPTLIEGRGRAVSEIAVPRPAATLAANKGAIEGAIGMILAYQLSSVRGAELKKALDRLEELGPQIEGYRKQGIDVTVAVVAEVPNQPDVAAAVTSVGDPGQVVYFKRMYISDISLPPSAATSTVSTIYAAGEQDPGRVHMSEMTLNQQVSAQFGEKYPVPGTGPRDGFHFVERKQTFPGYRVAKQAQTASPTAEQLKGIAGTYTPEFRQLFVGDISQMLQMSVRSLKVELDSNGLPVPKMTLAGRAYAFDNGGPTPKMAMTGRFKMGEGRPPDAQWYWSAMEYHPDKRLILEWARGQDGSLNTIWDALFLWRHV